jgi:hypothetical protein
MLDELPGLARRLKDFVRENPVQEFPCTEATESRRRILATLTAAHLTKAAMACRYQTCFPVRNDNLSLAELRSYENRVNTAPLASLLGSAAGLVRVLQFKMGQDNPCLGRHSPGRIWAELEYSPLGWPDLPDMAEADLNVLFEEGTPTVEVDPRDAAMLKTESVTLEQARREWGFP